MPYYSVVNLGDTVLSLAGVVQLQPKRATLINLDGFHQGIRSYVESALNSSIRGLLIQALAIGDRAECETATTTYNETPALEPEPAASDTSLAAASKAAKVETADLTGVFADGKATVETATASAPLDNTKPPAPPAPAPISKPVKTAQQVPKTQAPPAPPAAAEVPPAPPAPPAAAPEAPALDSDKPATIDQQAGLLASVLKK